MCALKYQDYEIGALTFQDYFNISALKYVKSVLGNFKIIFYEIEIVGMNGNDSF